MKEQPLVSIIMPVHNSEEYIGLAIKSVQKQSYNNWELIIIDDYSKDNTRNIIIEYSKDKRIKVISLQENIGIAGARNKAIRKAKGKYIAFLDSDDLWTADKLKKQINYMEQFKSYFTYTFYQVIDNSNSNIRLVDKMPKELDYSELLKSNSIGLLTVVINSELIKKELMPDIPHEDYATWLNILHKGYKAKLIPLVLASYRVQNNSRSSNKVKSMIWTWKIYRQNQHLSLILSIYYLLHYIYYGLRKHLN
ncbi:glycosyltransferase (plasmid) [Lactiplantibacillus plantarum 2025]|uniref:glycosyltransferase family 2 protein n=1 Tax=Lactiplantibacillus plantarum TaxID=1590 RepID=UPI0006C935FA|nr:glycosyltransferase family 2 protein [Lactiplantibacillus plantarum]QXD13567.1 glycosyltransferase [Lactiplantibacillus plantarum 2025]